MNPVDQYLASRLEERRLAGNLRKLKTERAEVDFFSNDYLGLVTSGKLAGVLQKSLAGKNTAPGSTGSRLLSGNSLAAEELENRIAVFHQAEAALLFNSGYDANVGLLACIASRNTTILSDQLCHASLIDGIRLSQCSRKYKFRHNDLNELEGQLKKYTEYGPVIVVVESVYSMDGDLAPLQEMADLCTVSGAQLIVDEAHATGVFGVKGEGLVGTLGLQDKVFARIHTFGKALGCHGAAVAGSALLKDYLVNFARTFIYTTALPAHALLAIDSAYRYLDSNSFSNKPLHELIAYFRNTINESGMIGWKDSISTIQALIVGENNRCKQLAGQLQDARFQVNAILHPTVPAGMERLRVCLHTFNTKDEINRLFHILT